MADRDLDSYPVKEDMRFQNTVWVIERVAWVLLSLVPLAALAGLFSNGPLSDRVAQAPNSAFSVEYERFQRVTVQARFVVRVPSTDADEVRLHLNPSFHLTYDIQSLQPETARASAGPNGLDLYFQPEDGALTAVIWATPRHFGKVDLRADIDGVSAEMPMFIYP